MSPEEIANFKTEYREPVLVASTVTAPIVPSSAEVVESKSSNRKKRGRPPKSKAKVEQHIGRNPLSSNQPSSPPSILLAIRPTPSVSENDLCPSSFTPPVTSRMCLPPSVPSHQLLSPLTMVSNSTAYPETSNSSIALGTLHYNYFTGIVFCSLFQRC